MPGLGPAPKAELEPSKRDIAVAPLLAMTAWAEGAAEQATVLLMQVTGMPPSKGPRGIISVAMSHATVPRDERAKLQAAAPLMPTPGMPPTLRCLTNRGAGGGLLMPTPDARHAPKLQCLICHGAGGGPLMPTPDAQHAAEAPMPDQPRGRQRRRPAATG